MVRLNLNGTVGYEEETHHNPVTLLASTRDVILSYTRINMQTQTVLVTSVIFTTFFTLPPKSVTVGKPTGRRTTNTVCACLSGAVEEIV